MHLTNFWLVPAFVLSLITTTAEFTCAASPKVEVLNLRRASHNGEHNAFTDLCRFRGNLYLTFRSCPDGHLVHSTAAIMILRSSDGQQWNLVHRFHVALRDTRDPHFLVFQERLFVYTGTWYSGNTTIPVSDYDMNKHLGYAAWSADGTVWNSPVMMEGTFGHYIWLLAKWGDHYVVAGRKTTPEKGPKTTFWWLIGERLEEFAELPSGGDTSYPGFVELSAGRALISYYSSHERGDDGKAITAIYLAELLIREP